MVFVWCAQIVSLRNVESGTLCAEAAPLGAEHGPARLLTLSFRSAIGNEASFVWQQQRDRVDILLPCPSKLDKWGYSALKDLNPCCFATFFSCFFNDSFGIPGTVHWDSWLIKEQNGKLFITNVLHSEASLSSALLGSNYTLHILLSQDKLVRYFFSPAIYFFPF